MRQPLPRSIIAFLMKNRGMILVSIFFFYLGCTVSVSFLHKDCANSLDTKLSNSVSQSLNDIRYVVLIISGPDNEVQRNSIRTTWVRLINNISVKNGKITYKWNNTAAGQYTKNSVVSYFFVVGTSGLSNDKMVKLYSENDRHDDMLMLKSFEDGYKHLSVKMLHSLKWIFENFIGLKYLIKCDDDSFVRVDLIVRDLEAYAPEMNAYELSNYVTYKKDLQSYKGLYWGYFMGSARIFMNGQWQEKDWFLCDNYLPYALGGGYVISQSIVEYVGKNSDVLSHYISEDVTMGVWTAALGGINRVHDIRFDTEWKSRGCSKHMLVRHKQSLADMLQLYKTLVDSRGETICESEFTVRPTYFYKWNRPPSLCCKRAPKVNNDQKP